MTPTHAIFWQELPPKMAILMYFLNLNNFFDKVYLTMKQVLPMLKINLLAKKVRWCFMWFLPTKIWITEKKLRQQSNNNCAKLNLQCQKLSKWTCTYQIKSASKLIQSRYFTGRNFRVFAFFGHFRETKSPRKQLESKIAKVIPMRNVRKVSFPLKKHENVKNP